MITVRTCTTSRSNVSSGGRSAPIAGFQPLTLVLCSAGLLVLSFPNFNQTWCSWVALVPWLMLLHGLGGRGAFWWSYLVGLLFFLGSIWWLIHVTVVGWLALCAYLALYFGLFGLIVSRTIIHHPSSIIHHLLVPSVWVATEYARSHLLSGFGWNLLAYSQAPWTPLIQLADVTGVWGVSFLIVLVNVALTALLTPTPRRDRVIGAAVAVVCLAAVLGYGAWRIPRVLGPYTARVAVVQGNIPQEEKWDATFKSDIIQRYTALTTTAAATGPDLIVWPETSVPALFESDDALTQQVAGLAKTIGRPLLVGAPARSESARTRALTNSAFLVAGSGAIGARYDKLHLVPFGEFIPAERVFPWLRDVLPPIGDFVPGDEHTVFTTPVASSELRVTSINSQLPTPNSQLKFSVLICFEDIFPELARRFVREGARLLLVITNDAWFGRTAAPYQHAQASMFRAIELRVPVARAANTGWSGCIDPAGRLIRSVRADGETELFVAGTQTCELPLGVANSPYRRWGDWFALLCLGGVIGWWGCRWRGRAGRLPLSIRQRTVADEFAAPRPARHPLVFSRATHCLCYSYNIDTSADSSYNMLLTIGDMPWVKTSRLRSVARS